MGGSQISLELWSAICRDPSKPFWITKSGARTYQDLRNAIENICGQLDHYRIERGAVTMIVTNDDWQAAVFWLACLLDGKIPTILSPDAPNDRLMTISELTQPALFVTNSEWLGEAWITHPEQCTVSIAINASSVAGESEAKIKTRAPTLICPKDGLAYLLFTSGTTSTPKGVAISHANLLAQLKTISRVLEIKANSRIFNRLVLYHVDGLIQGPVLAASQSATLLRPEIFSPTRLEEDMCWLRDTDATHMIGAPVLYEMILRLCREDDYFDRPTFHAMLSTSAKLSPDVWKRLEERFRRPVINEYGMTETVAATHFAGPHPEMGNPYTIGKPIDCEAKLVDPHGLEVAENEIGELLVKGVNIFQGYYKRPEDTLAVMMDGWFRTGDLCQKTKDGDFQIVGRKNTAINFAGFLIRPEEIDEVIEAYPGINEAQTIGVEDNVFGQVPNTGFTANNAIDPSTLTEFCRKKLENRKIPKRLVQLDEFPRTGSGKVDFTALREILVGVSQNRKVDFDQHDCTDSDLETKFLELAASIFGVHPSSLSLDDEPDDADGWDSYAHTALALEVEQAFSITLCASEIISIRRLGDFLRIIMERGQKDTLSEKGGGDIVNLERLNRGTGPSLIILPDLGGRTLYFRHVLKHIDASFAVWGLNVDSAKIDAKIAISVEDLAQMFCEQIGRADLPKPIFLLGHSFAGYLAYETARALANNSEIPANVFLLDTAVPWQFRRDAWLKVMLHTCFAVKKFICQHKDHAHRSEKFLEEFGFWRVPLRDYPPSMQKILKQLYGAMVLYRPKSYGGRVSLLKAKNKPTAMFLAGKYSGWDRFVCGSINVHQVPGNHLMIVRDETRSATTADIINLEIVRTSKSALSE